MVYFSCFSPKYFPKFMDTDCIKAPHSIDLSDPVPRCIHTIDVCSSLYGPQASTPGRLVHADLICWVYVNRRKLFSAAFTGSFFKNFQCCVLVWIIDADIMFHGMVFLCFSGEHATCVVHGCL